MDPTVGLDPINDWQKYTKLYAINVFTPGLYIITIFKVKKLKEEKI
jgi:hypothetical protein